MNGLLNKLGIKTPLSKVPILYDILFLKSSFIIKMIFNNCHDNYNNYQDDLKHKMNEIVNKVLLAGDKFMHKMHLKQTGFT